MCNDIVPIIIWDKESSNSKNNVADGMFSIMVIRVGTEDDVTDMLVLLASVNIMNIRG